MLVRSLIAASLAALATVAAAAPDKPAGAAASAPLCSVDLYVVDQDNFTNVRAQPDAKSKVEARIDPTYSVVRVTGVHGNWFRVSKIHDADNDMLLFEGDGWMHRSLLGLSVASGENWLMAEPNPAARKLLKLTPDGNRLEPLDCRGDWLKVTADGKATGWIAREAQCANPMTTCS
ncbi:MAG: SH3 domain-containing protein [Sphingomicrobium sp.]